MSKIEINLETMSIEFTEEIPYEYIEVIIETIKDKVKSWTDGDDKRFAEFRDNNIEECTDFVIDVENGLYERHKAGFLCEIENEFVRQTNGYTFQPMDVEELAQRMRDVLLLPRVRELDGLKESQMKISYQDCIQHLITHLRQLPHEE